MNEPKLKDIVYIYDGEFYLTFEGDGVGSPNGREYDTDEILAGEDSLPEEYLSNEITLLPWDANSIVVMVKKDKES